MIRMENVWKTYGKHRNRLHALSDINIEINQGDCIAITGKSGAGKSTFLNILGGLELPTKGQCFFQSSFMGNTINQLSEYRQKNIGFIVQNFALIDYYNIFDNIALPLKYRKVSNIKEQVYRISQQFDIADKLNQFPEQLSGGERQRAAIARALIKEPKVIIADEPTANLDSENREIVLSTLLDLNQKGMTIIIATHDDVISNSCNQRICLEKGCII